MAAHNDPVLVLRMANSITNLMGVCKFDEEFVASSGGAGPGEERFEVRGRMASDLSCEEKEEVYRIFEENMSYYYSKTWGLKKDEKMNELFHPTSRLFCLYTKSPESPNSGSLAAFTIFRFEWDDDEEPEYPVLYCYELQIQSSFQGKGLGKKLMEILAATAKKFKLEKVMLTCFNINEAAMSFYKAVGYVLDNNSPTKCGFPSDYEILSREITKM